MKYLGRLTEKLCGTGNGICVSQRSKAALKQNDETLSQLQQQVLSLDVVASKEKEKSEVELQLKASNDELEILRSRLAAEEQKRQLVDKQVAEQMKEIAEMEQFLNSTKVAESFTHVEDSLLSERMEADLQKELDKTKAELVEVLQAKQELERLRDEASHRHEELLKSHDAEKLKLTFERRAFAIELEAERSKAQQSAAEFTKLAAEKDSIRETVDMEKQKFAAETKKLENDLQESAARLRQCENEYAAKLAENTTRQEQLASDNADLKKQLSLTWCQISAQAAKIEEEKKLFWEELDALQERSLGAKGKLVVVCPRGTETEVTDQELDASSFKEADPEIQPGTGNVARKIATFRGGA